MLTEPEKKFYKDLYKTINTASTSEIIAQYCQILYNKEIKNLRKEQKDYEKGHSNGYLDALQHIIDIKQHITAIIRNIES